VIHSTTEGAMDHMHSMAKKYTGRDTYTPIRTGEVRVMFTIEPERIVTLGHWATQGDGGPRRHRSLYHVGVFRLLCYHAA
jgi:hypothetical protein